MCDFTSSPVLPSECEASEDSSGEAELEAELEAEPETSDLEDLRELHPGALLYRASRARNLPVMAEALAHGADVNAASGEDEGKTPLIQAVAGVRRPAHAAFCGCSSTTGPYRSGGSTQVSLLKHPLGWFCLRALKVTYCTTRCECD